MITFLVFTIFCSNRFLRVTLLFDINLYYRILKLLALTNSADKNEQLSE